MSTECVATWDQIVWQFQQIPHQHLINHNWGCAPTEHRDEWHVGPETYINGVPLTIDMDYIMGYLIEVVERTNGVVTYGVIVLFHGPKTIDLGDGEVQYEYEHDSMIYDKPCGTFFERTEAADPVRVGQWAVSVIHSLVEDWQEMKRKNQNS